MFANKSTGPEVRGVAGKSAGLCQDNPARMLGCFITVEYI